MDPVILEIDNALIPGFNELLENVSKENKIPYLDLTPFSSELKYTDGNHLLAESGTEVTKLIGDWIHKESFHSGKIE